MIVVKVRCYYYLFRVIKIIVVIFFYLWVIMNNKISSIGY